ncbi:MAG: coiled-coil protein, partial [Candidatus Bathyarchaeales archaeon]
ERLKVEAEDWAKKRDELNEQIKRLRAEILELKTERNKLNEDVKQLKQKRNEMLEKMLGKIEEAKRLNEELKELDKKKPRKSISAVQKEIDAIEWKIQTSPSNLQEEKMLVEKVKNLEAQRALLTKFEQTSQRLLELRAEIKALETEGKSYHERLTEKANKSQELHERMLEKIEELNKVKAEADEFHRQFIAVKENIAPINEEIQGLLNQIRTLKGELLKEKIDKARESEEALREKLKQQVREKLKRGEKLTWEEFQLLEGEDL